LSKLGSVSADYLWRTAASPAVMSLRARAWQLLGLLPGARVLDIGCGPGTATLGLASLVGSFGEVIGIDADMEMVRSAATAAHVAGLASWAKYQQGDATRLPFPSGTFDACYCERVLQHLDADQATAAVAEAARVTRSGGAICLVDSDWASFSVETSEPELERRLQPLQLARFANPLSGRTLGRMLRAQGLGFVVTEPIAIPLSAPGALDLLARTVQNARESEALNEAELARWHAAAAARLAEPGFAGHLTMVIAVGRRL
jgi:ubiquinone/menaquinone biosynthesis C-methylase UbiE